MAGCPIDVAPTLGRTSRRPARARCSTTSRRTTRASGGCCSTSLPPLNPRLDGAEPRRPRHGAGRAARLRGRPALVLPGRGRQRGVPRDAAPAHLRAPARAAHRLPDARGPQRVDASPRPVATGSTERSCCPPARRRHASGPPLRNEGQPPGVAITASGSRPRRSSPTRRSSARSCSRPRTTELLRAEQRAPHPHVGRRGVLPARRGDRGLPLRLAGRLLGGVRPELEPGDYLLLEEVGGR